MNLVAGAAYVGVKKSLFVCVPNTSSPLTYYCATGIASRSTYCKWSTSTTSRWFKAAFSNCFYWTSEGNSWTICNTIRETKHLGHCKKRKLINIYVGCIKIELAWVLVVTWTHLIAWPRGKRLVIPQGVLLSSNAFFQICMPLKELERVTSHTMLFLTVYFTVHFMHAQSALFIPPLSE